MCLPSLPPIHPLPALAPGPLVRFHDGAGFYDTHMTTTFLRLKRGYYYKLKVKAANPSGYGLVSSESLPVQTLTISEPVIVVRLNYAWEAIFDSNNAEDKGQTEKYFNASFIQEWTHQLKLPQNRLNIVQFYAGEAWRIGYKHSYIYALY
jgi:hypothetical protein